MSEKNLDQKTLKILLEKGIISKKDIDELTKVKVITNDNLQLKYCLNQFMLHLREEYSDNTMSAYITTIEGFFQYVFKVDSLFKIQDDMSVCQIDSYDIENWFTYLIANGYSASSIRRSKYGLKKFFNFISELGYNSPDISAIKTPQNEDIDIDALMDNEVRGIVEYAKLLRDKVIVLFMYETGMRRQELIDCMKEHLDFTNNTVKIYKNMKFDRVGYFSEEVAKLLVQYMDEWVMEVSDINDKRYNRSLTKGEQYRELTISPYLFQTPRSEQINYSTIFKALKEMAFEYFFNQEINQGLNDEDAKEVAEDRISTINTETLRHSRRAYLFASGKDINQVQVLMGDENRWVCNRYQKIAQKLYPESYRY